MMFINFREKTEYPKKFKPGDKAKCLQATRFTDGTRHTVGQIITIEKGCESYYNVCHQYYEKVN